MHVIGALSLPVRTPSMLVRGGGNGDGGPTLSLHLLDSAGHVRLESDRRLCLLKGLSREGFGQGGLAGTSCANLGKGEGGRRGRE